MYTFFTVKLYADVTLQVFFILTCINGWYQWKKGGKNNSELPITHVELKSFSLYIICSCIVVAAYGSLLHKLTDASSPFFDSTILAFSILGQFLVMKRKFENWYIWFLVDGVSIPLYFSKGLYLTSLLYIFLLIIGIYGYFNWKKEIKIQTTQKLK